MTRNRSATGPLAVTATLAALYVGLPLPGVGATPPDGDITRTDIARGDTLAPVSINTDSDSTFLVQGLRLGPSTLAIVSASTSTPQSNDERGLSEPRIDQ